MGIEVAIVLGSIAVASTAASMVQQRKAEKQQKKAREVSRASQTTAAIEQRRQQVREERVRRAKLLAAAEGTGVSGSSGEAGAISSLATNFGHNMAFSQGQSLSADVISGYNQKAANANYNANLFGGISSIFMSAASMSMAGAGGGAKGGTTTTGTTK